ncbi:MAG: hypothetical protein KDI44_06225 [Thiothrix sp.]|nr:hypothetical protein [Thiothrix sp.]HPQ96814.1 hypothetical protein [Thiolinea sp.]
MLLNQFITNKECRYRKKYRLGIFSVANVTHSDFLTIGRKEAHWGGRRGCCCLLPVYPITGALVAVDATIATTIRPLPFPQWVFFDHWGRRNEKSYFFYSLLL